MIATTGGGGVGWGRATEAAAGEGMSSGNVCVFCALCLMPLASCTASKATTVQISFALEGGPDRALWTAQDFALRSV
jgi:hypothetical protein